MRTIKRYSNRKLYDTKERHYVRLDDVARFVCAGDEVQIFDYVTGADLTSQTLAQCIYEEEKRGPKLSVEVLRKVLVQGEDLCKGLTTP